MRTWTYSLCAAVLVLFACDREPETLIEEGFRLWRVGNYLDAVEQFQAFSLRYPREDFAPKALYLAAGGYASQLHDYPRAVSVYLTLTRKYPDSDLAPESMRKVGDLYRLRLGDLKKAVMYYGAVTDRYKKSPQAAESQYLIGMCYMDLQQFDQARVEFQHLIKDHPKSRFVPMATYQIASTYYAEGDCGEAGKHFQSLIADFPTHALTADAKTAKASCGRAVQASLPQAH